VHIFLLCIYKWLNIWGFLEIFGKFWSLFRSISGHTGREGGLARHTGKEAERVTTIKVIDRAKKSRINKSEIRQVQTGRGEERWHKWNHF
jgi:hypothetical protein